MNDLFQIPSSLALGVFGALLAALVFVIALALGSDSRWPSLREITRRPALITWAATGILAILVGVVAGVDRSTAEALRAACFVLTAVSFVSGFVALVESIEVTTIHGRRRFIAVVLRSSLIDGADGLPWLQELRRALTTGDTQQANDLIASMRVMVEESTRPRSLLMSLGGLGRLRMTFSPDEHTGLLQLLLSAVNAVGVATVVGGFDVESGANAVTELSQIAGLAAGSHLPGQPAHNAGAFIGLFSRELAAITEGALLVGGEGSLTGGGSPAKRLDVKARVLVVSCSRARSGFMEAVDPDPPGRFIADSEPWSHGLSDPGDALAWYAGFNEFAGFGSGGSVFALYEVLAGRKFRGSYWRDQYPLEELTFLVRGDPSAYSAAAAFEPYRLASTREVLESIGSPAARVDPSLHALAGDTPEQLGWSLYVLEVLARFVAGSARGKRPYLPSRDIHFGHDLSTNVDSVARRLRNFTRARAILPGADAGQLRGAIALLMGRVANGAFAFVNARQRGTVPATPTPLLTQLELGTSYVLAVVLSFVTSERSQERSIPCKEVIKMAESVLRYPTASTIGAQRDRRDTMMPPPNTVGQAAAAHLSLVIDDEIPLKTFAAKARKAGGR